MKRFLLPLTLLSILGFSIGCGWLDDGVAAVTSAPCANGLTPLDSMGRVLQTDGGVVIGDKAVKICDDTSPTGSRVLLVTGIKEGKPANNQSALLVDSHGNALTADALRGMTSKKATRVPGTHFRASCQDVTPDGVGCSKVKPPAAVASSSTVTITVPAGTPVVVTK